MLSLRVGCEFGWKSEIPTAAIVQVEPRPDLHRFVTRAAWSTIPEIPSRMYTDTYGNLCRRITLPVGGMTIAYDALLQIDSAPDEADESAPELHPAELPDDTLAFTLPSRFCQSDLLGDDAWRLFGGLTPGYSRVQDICDFVHRHLTWEAGASVPSTTAVDVYRSGRGVCRDFAHLAVSFCRALNIPARYAFGYLPELGAPATEEPMDFCAWMEVYLGDRWYTFDPRNNARRAGRVLIGRGRDALDVAMFTTFGGPQLLELNVWADAVPESPAVTT